MYMKFFTNIPEPRNGFKALFEIPKCRHEYKSARGSISSDNYPNPGGYKPHMVCEYVFNYVQNQRVNITFTDIDLPFKENTLNESDYLTVSNIFMTDRTEVEAIKIMGNTSLGSLPSIISDTANVIVRFYTFKPNVDKKYRGFKLDFKRVYGACSRDVVDSSGELYLRNMKTFTCIWKITVPKGQRVKVFVDEIETSNRNDNVRLRFYDDFEMSIPLAIFERATAENISPISSSDNQMLILVNQNRITGGAIKSLKIHWTSDEESICPTISLDDTEGTLSFQNIGNNLKCTTNFRLERNETLSIKVNELIVVQRLPVLIRPSSFPDVGVKIGTTNLKSNITSEIFPVTGIFNRFSILQRNSSATEIVTFKGSFKKHPCGGIFTNIGSTTLVLAKIKDSIGSPNQKYGEIDCFWQVWTSSALNNITITPKVQMTGNCDEEYLKFYRGNSIRSPLLKTICGENSTAVPWSIANTFLISIHYHARNYQPDKNVEVVVGKSLNCGGKFNMAASSYDIYRVDFGQKDYQNNLECVWEISTSSYFNLEVKFYNRFFIGK